MRTLRSVSVGLPRLTGLAVLVVTAQVGVSCGSPKIHSFEIEPIAVCAGQETKIAWDVRGEPELQMRYRPVEEGVTGEPDTITLVLVARRGSDSVTDLEDVLQFPERFSHQIVFSTTREGDEVVAQGEQNPAKWPEHFVVEAIESASNRKLHIRHAGIEAELPADGTASEAFKGTPVAGMWEFRSRILPEEPPPDRLRVHANVACKL